MAVLDPWEEVNGEVVDDAPNVSDTEVFDEPDDAVVTSLPVRVSRPSHSEANDVNAEAAMGNGDSREDTPRFGNGGLSLSPISRSRPGAAQERGRNLSKEAESRRRPLSAAEEAARAANRRQGLADLTEEAEAARHEYARLSAGRANRRHFRGKNAEFKQAAVVEAKEEYKERAEALKRREKTLARHAGVSEDDLLSYDNEFSVGEAKRMMNAMHHERLAATGRFAINAAGRAELRTHGQFFVDTKGKAYRVNSLPPREGGVSHFKPRSRNVRHINKLSGDLREALYQHGRTNTIGSIIDAQTENEVYHNRRRMVGGAAAPAAGRATARKVAEQGDKALGYAQSGVELSKEQAARARELGRLGMRDMVDLTSIWMTPAGLWQFENPKQSQSEKRPAAPTDEDIETTE